MKANRAGHFTQHPGLDLQGHEHLGRDVVITTHLELGGRGEAKAGIVGGVSHNDDDGAVEVPAAGR